ncbi:MAG: amino-acid N-acetyltransferase [Verrucomicrobiae bacterium]|nr:amino-acid N-acetyltransferase [Verrucomicrobiae bacterium]
MKPVDLRGILKYVPQYRNKIFVIALDGVITESENFSNILLDVAVLCSLNIRVVLVHGVSSQIQKIADTMEDFKPSDVDGSGITDDQTLKVALIAANRCTHEILEGLSTVDLRAVTCNGIISHPMGIIRGVDHLYTGKVERVDVEMFQTLLKDAIIPVAPPLGFDGEGNTYRVNSDNVACALGVQLQAQKVIFVTATDGLYCNEEMIGSVQAQDLQEKMNRMQSAFRPEQISKAQYAIQACQQGVPRVHLINGLVNESLITEIFSNEGVGTLIYANEYQQIRRATRKDIRTIMVLIRQAMKTEELSVRTYQDVESRIQDYYLFEIDGHAVGCVALHLSEDKSSGELACLFVTCHYENRGIGRKLIGFIEERARALKLKKIIVLSTQTYTYFKSKGGFVDGSQEDLTPERLEKYHQSRRRSRILVKRLEENKN